MKTVLEIFNRLIRLAHGLELFEELDLPWQQERSKNDILSPLFPVEHLVQSCGRISSNTSEAHIEDEHHG